MPCLWFCQPFLKRLPAFSRHCFLGTFTKLPRPFRITLFGAHMLKCPCPWTPKTTLGEGLCLSLVCMPSNFQESSTEQASSVHLWNKLGIELGPHGLEDKERKAKREEGIAQSTTPCSQLGDDLILGRPQRGPHYYYLL